MAGNSDVFRNVVETVFNNWTALRLAVEHGMGTKDKADLFVTNVLEMFSKANVDVDYVADYLIDFMDSEFQTLCEDDSPDEVAAVLWQFHQQCKSGNLDLVTTELNKLPKCNIWLCKPLLQESERDVTGSDYNTSNGNNIPDSSSSQVNANSDMDTVMETEEVDPEWTTVKSRRRKE